MILHGFKLSSASYRVRIALNLLAVAFTEKSYMLRQGEQHSEAYRALNPQQLVPALELDDGRVISQSLAIIQYLDDSIPDAGLIPRDPFQRARVMEIVLGIACDLHPLNNLRVLQYLQNQLGCSGDTVKVWYRHWVGVEFEALERRLRALDRSGDYCVGDAPSIADIFLVPQVLNARRFDCDLSDYPLIRRIDAHCTGLPAFAASHPDRVNG